MTLVILEVSRKQGYIFSSRALKDNVRRSQEIAYVTGNGGGAFFRKAAGELFQEEQLVSTGGGHTVLRFPDSGQARAFVSRVTEAALRRFPGMELYAKIMPYDCNLSLGDNLDALVKALEAKKARRRASFRRRSVGVEALDRERWAPLPVGAAKRCAHDIERAIDEMEERLSVPAWTYPREFGRILKAAPEGDNFLVVAHIDGNAMGKRSRRLYEDFEKRKLGFEDSCAHLRRFSDGIQEDFETAFLMTAEKLADYCRRMGKEGGELPIRLVILAGDDVTFVVAGRYGLECARLFLEALSERRPTGGRCALPGAGRNPKRICVRGRSCTPDARSLSRTASICSRKWTRRPRRRRKSLTTISFPIRRTWNSAGTVSPKTASVSGNSRRGTGRASPSFISMPRGISISGVFSKSTE